MLKLVSKYIPYNALIKSLLYYQNIQIQSKNYSLNIILKSVTLFTLRSEISKSVKFTHLLNILLIFEQLLVFILVISKDFKLTHPSNILEKLVALEAVDAINPLLGLVVLFFGEVRVACEELGFREFLQ